MGGVKRKACGQGLDVTLVFTIAQLMNYRDSKLKGTLGTANTMQNESHLGAAEFDHSSPLPLPTTSEKDQLTVDEHPKLTMAQAMKARERSQVAHRKFLQPTGEATNV
jgi:hypothetical protein